MEDYKVGDFGTKGSLTPPGSMARYFCGGTRKYKKVAADLHEIE